MIVGIQTNGIGKVNVGNAKANNLKNRTEDNASDTFAGIMNLSSQAVQSEKQNVQAKTDTTVSISEKKPVFSMNASYSDASERITESVTDNRADAKKTDTSVSEKGQTDDSNVKNQVDVQKDARKADSPTDRSQTDKSSVDKAEKDLADKIKQVLGIDDEKLQQLLADAGLSMQELLNPEVLQQFVLQVNDASSVDMLIDENLNQAVNQLLQALDEVLTDNGIAESIVPETLSTEEDVQVLDFEAENDKKVSPETETDGKSESADVKSTTTQGTQREISVTQNTESQIKVTVQTQGGEQAGGQNGQMSQNNDTVLANFNQALNQVVGNDVSEVNGFSEQITQADILRQVVDEIKLSMSRDVNSLSVQLNPEQLGKVQIHVATKNGVMQAQIIAENEAAKNAVESGLSVLREAFENQDLKVDAIEVMVGTQDYFAESGQDTQSGDTENEKTGNRSGGINLNDISDDEISEDIQLEVEMMKAQGNRVNYTA